MKLLDVLKKLRKRIVNYSPSVEIFISKRKLLENLKEYESRCPGMMFAPVLKSNAYGHGIIPVARILDKKNVAFFVLDSLHEAMILRGSGIKSEILIIGFTKPENIRRSRLSRVAFAVTSLDQLREINKTISSKLKIHLKIDTGMHRQGIMLKEINEAINIVKNNKLLVLDGVCSHFADADNIDAGFTRSQIDEWNRIIGLFQDNFQKIKYFHISATAGTAYCDKSYGNIARLGLGLYGINPSPISNLKLQPVLKMQSVVSSIRDLETGEHVGYNATYKTTQKAKIATVPVGYFEGVDRRLSNRGVLKIGDHYCPIVGRVSMNITSVDISSAPGTRMGDKITIISDCTDDRNSAESIARLTETIPWEVLVRIPQHLRRTVVDD